MLAYSMFVGAALPAECWEGRMQRKQIWTDSSTAFDSSEIETVYHVLNSIRMFDDPDEILAAVVTSLQSDLRAKIVAILRLGSGKSSNLELVKAIDEAGSSRYLSKVVSGDVEMDWGFLPLMVSDFLPQTFDFSASGDHPTARYLFEKCSIGGALCAPIVLDGAMLGLYSLLYEQVPEISEQEKSFFVMLGGAVAAVLEFCDLQERYNAFAQKMSSIDKRDAVRLHAKALCDILDEIMCIPTDSGNDIRCTVDRPRDLLQPFVNLTQGELNVLALVSAGFSNGEIAERLYISDGTVKKRIGNIMTKLNLKNRTQIGVYFARFAR